MCGFEITKNDLEAKIDLGEDRVISQIERCWTQARNDGMNEKTV